MNDNENDLENEETDSEFEENGGGSVHESGAIEWGSLDNTPTTDDNAEEDLEQNERDNIDELNENNEEKDKNSKYKNDKDEENSLKQRLGYNTKSKYLPPQLALESEPPKQGELIVDYFTHYYSHSRGFLIPYAAEVVLLARIAGIHQASKYLGNKFNRKISTKPITDILYKTRNRIIIVTEQDIRAAAQNHPLAKQYLSHFPQMANPRAVDPDDPDQRKVSLIAPLVGEGALKTKIGDTIVPKKSVLSGGNNNSQGESNNNSGDTRGESSSESETKQSPITTHPITEKSKNKIIDSEKDKRMADEFFS